MSVTNVIRNPRTYIANKWRLYRRLLFNPEAFYEEEAGERGLRYEIILVLLIGLVGTAIAYYTVQALFEPFSFAASPPPGSYTLPEQAVQQIRLQGYIYPVAGILATWLWFSVSLYAVSWLYSDVGSMFHTLKNTAWALLPFLFFNILRGGAKLASVMLESESEADAWASTVSSMTDPEEIAPAVLGHAAGDIITIAATVVGFVFVVWAGYISAYGIADVRGLETEYAYRVAAVPVVGFILYIVSGML